MLQEVVHQSILTNQIPRAQAVLRRQNRPECHLPALRREGLRQVSSCLRRRDLQTANTLLANMVRAADITHVQLQVIRKRAKMSLIEEK